MAPGGNARRMPDALPENRPNQTASLNSSAPQVTSLCRSGGAATSHFSRHSSEVWSSVDVRPASCRTGPPPIAHLLAPTVAQILPMRTAVSGLVTSVVRSGTGVPSDAVFRALDGHQFDFDGSTCHVEVYGVYDAGDRRWVQLALADERERMVTLRVDANHGIECALVSLAVKPVGIALSQRT